MGQGGRVFSSFHILKELCRFVYLWSIVECFCTIWMNWLTNCPVVYLFLPSCCSVHMQKKSHLQPAGGAKKSDDQLKLDMLAKERSHKINFDCSEIIWEWKWVVCISADVLLLLFAQYCSPLLMRKSGNIFFFFGCMLIMIPAFSRRFHKYLFWLSAFSCRPLFFTALRFVSQKFYSLIASLNQCLTL